MPKVLLADNSITIQKVVELVLGDKGYEVKAVNTGGEALAALSSFKPDIVLADVSLPDINGYELTGKVRDNESTKNVPVLLLAGAFEPVDENRKSSTGASDSLTKPFEAEDLLGKIETLLGTPSASGDETEEAFEVSEAEVSEAEEAVAEALKAADAEEELLDISELDEEPVEVEVLEELAGQATEGDRGVAGKATPAEARAEAPPSTSGIGVPGENKILSAIKDSVDSALGKALANMDAIAKEAVNENLAAAMGGVDEAVRKTVTESLNAVLGGIEQQMLESVNKGLSEALNISELKDSLKEHMKATAEKVLWEAAPELTQELIKDTLKESIGSLKTEVEKVIWETVPDLAESIIKSEIDKIRSKK